VSHFNEKVRWALAYKGVEHERRAPPPPAHMAVALALTRGRAKTFPILELNGETVADSTDIIAALEEGYPDPPLYPADPAERRRALELEDFFDEELGPQIRLLGWNLVTQDPERLKRLAVESATVADRRRSLGIGNPGKEHDCHRSLHVEHAFAVSRRSRRRRRFSSRCSGRSLRPAGATG
jgi:glutathione S-transferase